MRTISIFKRALYLLDVVATNELQTDNEILNEIPANHEKDASAEEVAEKITLPSVDNLAVAVHVIEKFTKANNPRYVLLLL